jgi:hypothetical protein
VAALISESKIQGSTKCNLTPSNGGKEVVLRDMDLHQVLDHVTGHVHHDERRTAARTEATTGSVARACAGADGPRKELLVSYHECTGEASLASTCRFV